MRLVRSFILLAIMIYCTQALAQRQEESNSSLKIGIGYTGIPEFSHSARFRQRELYNGLNLYIGRSRKLRKGRLRVNPIIGFNYFERIHESRGKQKFLSAHLSSDYRFDFIKYKSFSYYGSVGVGGHLNSNISGPCFYDQACELEKELNRFGVLFSGGLGFRIEPRDSRYGFGFDNEVELAFDNLIRVHASIEMLIKID